MSNFDFIKPIKMKSASDIVVDRLTQAIIDGDLPAGSKIPTEPELAANFHVGRNTVREAIRTLIAYGILEIRRPEGTFVCDKFRPTAINPMIYSLIIRDDSSYQDLIGLRKCIEYGTLHVIVDQGLDPNDLETLQHLAEVVDNNIEALNPDPRTICDADIDFHNAIASATKNPLIIKVNDMISKLAYGSRLKTIENCLSVGEGSYISDTHFRLAKALENRNDDDVDKALQYSYIYWAQLNPEAFSASSPNADNFNRFTNFLNPSAKANK